MLDITNEALKEEVLESSKTQMWEKIGDLSDFPRDFQNLVCNVFYYSEAFESGIIGDSDVSSLSDYSDLGLVLGYLPEFVSNLRDLKQEARDNVFAYATDSVKTLIMYPGNKVLNKVPLWMSKVLNKFRKPVIKEIPNLIDEMGL